MRVNFWFFFLYSEMTTELTTFNHLSCHSSSTALGTRAIIWTKVFSHSNHINEIWMTKRTRLYYIYWNEREIKRERVQMKPLVAGLTCYCSFGWIVNAAFLTVWMIKQPSVRSHPIEANNREKSSELTPISSYIALPAISK